MEVRFGSGDRLVANLYSSTFAGCLDQCLTYVGTGSAQSGAVDVVSFRHSTGLCDCYTDYGHGFDKSADADFDLAATHY